MPYVGKKATNVVDVSETQSLTVDGDLTISDKIVHSGDTNTAIRFADADTVTVETAGSERLRISSAGFLGVGTTAPENPIEIETTNKLGGTFTGTTDGEGLRVTQTDYTSGNFVSLVEAPYDDSQTAANVRIGAMFDGSGSNIVFGTSNSYGSGITNEAMRIDSSARLLVGKTTNAIGTAGHTIQADGFVSHTRDGNYPLGVNRLSDDGDIVQFFKDGTAVGKVVTRSGGAVSSFVFDPRSSGSGLSGGTNQIQPANNAGAVVDNTIALGSSTTRFDDAFITNGVTTGSDQNEKQNIASLTNAEITAAKAISKLFKTFKWKDAVTQKGDGARIHTGVIAQEVQSAMTDAGLDATKYAFWCSDTWWQKDVEVAAVEAVEAKDAVYDSDGNVVSEAVDPSPAQDAYTRMDVYESADAAPEGATERTRLGIRYPELLAFVGAATEQRLADIETRLTALEG